MTELTALPPPPPEALQAAEAALAALATPAAPATGPASRALPALETAAIPRATYRLQLHGGFGLAQAEAIVPYIAALGASHVYTSPLLKARTGSTHGYDVTDHEALNPELGDADALDRFCAALRRHGLGLVVDVVPNHMGVHEADNPWWLDVLEHGEASRYSHYFDIDWRPAMRGMHGRVLLPVLGDQYGKVLEAGELKLAFDPATAVFCVRYWNHRFPVDPREVPRILQRASAIAADAGEREASAALMLACEGFAALTETRQTPPEQRATRAALAAAARLHLATLVASQPAALTMLERAIDALNGTPGDAASFDALDALLQAMPWRLAYWGMAADENNYRRFFDVTALAAVRSEDPEVFAATHRRILEWVGEGRVQGLRIDHPDGLRDPAGYFDRLQAACADRIEAATGERRAGWIVVEKILGEHERLRAGWPVHGTTGYDFANLVNGVFVDADNATRFDRVYTGFLGQTADFADTLYRCKHLILTHVLASELDILTEMLWRIAQEDRRTRDFTHNRLRNALAEVIAAFPVYRTYVSAQGVDPEDVRFIDWAMAGARRRGRAAEATGLAYLREVLLGAPGCADPALRGRMLDFVARFQQVTSPVMAKGFEDTALYRYVRLVSLNDVGGDPAHFGVSVARFHAENLQRARSTPHAMIATSTHDSKRSEDVRARIDVLSEAPAEWRLALRRWSRLNRRARSGAAGRNAPTRNDEVLLYQTLLGVLPEAPLDETGLAELRERIQAYMLKAIREAKDLTSWIDPDPDYEAAVASFVERVLASVSPNPFLTDVRALLARIAPFARANALAMVLFKLTAPGVPDLYQGCETWNLSLVDPDNRRTPDYERLARTAQALRPHLDDPDRRERVRGWMNATDGSSDGCIKTWLTLQCLALRARRPTLFRDGAYAALAADGAAAAHVIAYRRSLSGDEAITVGLRLGWRLTRGDPGALLAALAGSALVLDAPTPGRYRDLLTGTVHEVRGDDTGRGRIALDQLLAVLPVALLVPLDNDDVSSSTSKNDPT